MRIKKGSVRRCNYPSCPGYGTWVVTFSALAIGTERMYEHYATPALAMNEYREHDRKVREHASANS